MKHFLIYEDEQSLRKHYEEPDVDLDKPTIVRKWEQQDKERKAKDKANKQSQAKSSIPNRPNDPEFNKAKKDFEGIFKEPDVAAAGKTVKPAATPVPRITPSTNPKLSPEERGLSPHEDEPFHPDNLNKKAGTVRATPDPNMKYYQKVQPKNNQKTINKARGIKEPKPEKQQKQPKEKKRANVAKTAIEVGKGIASTVAGLQRYNMGRAGQY